MGNHFKIMMQMQKSLFVEKILKPNSVNKLQQNNSFTCSWIETVDLQIDFLDLI